jgi:hypothetical protein
MASTIFRAVRHTQLRKSFPRPAPQVIGKLLNADGSPLTLTFARSVKMTLNAAKTRAYLCSTASERFAIVDITDPLNGMRVIGHLNDSTNLNGANSCSLSADERYAFVSCELAGCVTVIDMVDEANPQVVLKFQGPSPGTSLAGAANHRRSGNTLFIPTISRMSVALISCADPLNLAWLSEMRGPTPGTTYSTCRDVELDAVNHLAYAAAEGRKALQVFDWTDTANPVHLLELRDTLNLNAIRGVKISANKQFLWAGIADGVSAAPRGALTTFSLAVPAVPAQLPTTVFGTGAFSDATSMNGLRGIAEYGDYLVTTGDNSLNLHIWNKRSPGTPKLIVQTQGAVKGVDYNHAMGIEIVVKGGKVIALVTMFATNGLDNRGMIAVDTGIAA